jgi:tetratricopeptide (TPR) repeat protein
MKLLACAVFSLLVLTACTPAATPPPRDPALMALFDELRGAGSSEAAAPIEQKIWAKWGQSGSPSVDILLERAQAAEAAGDAAGALDFLREASALAPGFAEPWNRRASLAYDAHDYAGAIRAIEETLKREPRHFGTLAGLGLIYEELGQERAALEAFRAALAIHPQYEAAKRGAERLERTFAEQAA